MHNGWKNYQTWNVVKWIAYNPAIRSMASECLNYPHFLKRMKAVNNYSNGELTIAVETPDGVRWDDPSIDREAIGDWWNDTFPLPCKKLASSVEEFGVPKGGF